MLHQFMRWIMLTMTTVSYKFNINGEYTQNMQPRREFRKGDPLSPFLFFIIYGVLNRGLHKMQKNP